jgi:hypothetical protein
MNTFIKYQIIIIWGGIASIVFLLWLIGYEIAINYSFNGVVEHVSYDIQHTPTVSIKGLKYNLDYSHWGHYQDSIEVGDSMIKKSGETYIKLIKRNKRYPVSFPQK